MSRPGALSRRTLLRRAALAMPALLAPPGFSLGTLLSDTPPSGRGKSTIVIGAGLAGLAAAYELVAQGCEVTVLEAQMRAGGRVRTLRFADGLHAEAGAMTFSDSRYIRQYLEAFHLEVVPLGPRGLATVHHLRGRRLLVKPGEEADWPYELSPEERKLGFPGMIRNYLFSVRGEIGDPNDPDWRLDAFEKYDRMTLAEFLKAEGATDEAVDYLAHRLVFGHGWSTGSALNRLVSDVALFTSGNGRVSVLPGGSEQLPEAFARALRRQIYYGCPVVRIAQTADEVRVSFRQGGALRTLVADRLICTVPCPPLRRIEFSPELPAAKRRVIADLEYMPVTRVFLQTRRRLWEDAGCVGSAFTDLPVGVVTEQPLLPMAEESPRGIVESHLKGATAARVASLAPEAQLAFAGEDLEKVHPGFLSYLEGGTTVGWGEDPWAGGGYAWFRPGQLSEWRPELARPEGRIHFAGEHTSAFARTVEGALESGNRAAREVLERVRTT